MNFIKRKKNGFQTDAENSSWGLKKTLEISLNLAALRFIFHYIKPEII